MTVYGEVSRVLVDGGGADGVCSNAVRKAKLPLTVVIGIPWFSVELLGGVRER